MCGGMVSVICADPVPVAVCENKSRLGSLLVIVTETAVWGTPTSLTLTTVSRFFPTDTFGAFIPAALTLAVRLLADAPGLLKPAGTLAVTLVLPEPAALNRVVTLWSPPLKTRGEVVIVPTAVLTLATFTLAEKPPRTRWVSAKLNEESSRAA